MTSGPSRRGSQPVIRPDELDRAVDGLFAAVLGSGDGIEAQEWLARAMNAASFFFYPKDAAPLVPQLPNLEAIRPFITDFVNDGWYLRDPRASRGWPLVDAGRRVVIEHDIASDDERRVSPFHQELLRDHKLPWWAAVAFDVDGHRWCLPIHRSAVQGAFSREEARLLEPLSGRLGTLIGLAQRLGDARANGAMDALTRLRSPAILLDSAGRVLRANEHAERLFDADFGVMNGRLRAGHAASDDALQTLLARASTGLWTPEARTDATGKAIVSRPGRRPLLVETLPIRTGFADAFSGAAALLTITDVAARPAPPERLLAEMFGLTPAEARLAAALATGAPLDDIADAFAIARETARKRLKAVFAKTATSRQAELVALLARLSRSSTK